jgi:hypothetical protein
MRWLCLFLACQDYIYQYIYQLMRLSLEFSTAAALVIMDCRNIFLDYAP